jgi:hypothetical protein
MGATKLLGPAKDIFEEIEALIPHTTTVDEDENGNKEYGGDALSALITSMKIALGIDEVGVDITCVYVSLLTVLIRLGKDIRDIGRKRRKLSILGSKGIL